MRRILVTGASGFIGSALCRQLLRDGELVTAFVRDEDPPEGCAVIRGRLEDADDVRRALLSRTWDVVYHLGAQALVGVGHMDPLTTLKSNVAGTWNVLEGFRHMSGRAASLLVVASSDKAYGRLNGHHLEGIRQQYHETDPLAGRGIYDCSKSCADLISQAYADEYGMNVRIARLGNVYGPGDPEPTRIVPSIVEDLVSIRRPVIRSDGSPVRDYLFIDDAVSAYVRLGQDADVRVIDYAFNFSGKRPLSVLELTRLATDIACAQSQGGKGMQYEEPDLSIWAGCQCLGDHLAHVKGTCGERRPREELEPEILGQRGPHEIPYQALDCSWAEKELGWTPKTSLEEGLRRTIRWAWRRKNGIDWT